LPTLIDFHAGWLRRTWNRKTIFQKIISSILLIKTSSFKQERDDILMLTIFRYFFEFLSDFGLISPFPLLSFPSSFQEK